MIYFEASKVLLEKKGSKKGRDMEEGRERTNEEVW
jgi:hypothetical protein